MKQFVYLVLDVPLWRGARGVFLIYDIGFTIYEVQLGIFDIRSSIFNIQHSLFNIRYLTFTSIITNFEQGTGNVEF